MAAINIMVMISNPDNFLSWPDDRKLHRYRRVLQWHDYIAALHLKGKVTHVWGSHQLLSRAQFTSSMGVLIAIYTVDSWYEFDELLIEDPLRDLSQYVTTPLSTLFEDRQSDRARYEQHKEKLLGGKDQGGKQIYEDYRALYNQPPFYVDQYEYHQPNNKPTRLEDRGEPGDSLRILVFGMNPPEYITLWDDTRKLIHHEKVVWWHDYMSMMIHQNKITHSWGTHDYCLIAGPSTNSAGAVAIYEVKDYEEFDELYRLDPIRDATIFWTVLLQPISDQRRLDEARFRQATRLLAESALAVGAA